MIRTSLRPPGRPCLMEQGRWHPPFINSVDHETGLLLVCQRTESAIRGNSLQRSCRKTHGDKPIFNHQLKQKAALALRPVTHALSQCCALRTSGRVGLLSVSESSPYTSPIKPRLYVHLLPKNAPPIVMDCVQGKIKFKNLCPPTNQTSFFGNTTLQAEGLHLMETRVAPPESLPRLTPSFLVSAPGPSRLHHPPWQTEPASQDSPVPDHRCQGQGAAAYALRSLPA